MTRKCTCGNQLSTIYRDMCFTCAWDRKNTNMDVAGCITHRGDVAINITSDMQFDVRIPFLRKMWTLGFNCTVKGEDIIVSNDQEQLNEYDANIIVGLAIHYIRRV